MFASLVHSTVALGVFYFSDPDTGAEISAEDLKGILAAQFDSFENLITHRDVPKAGINLLLA